MSSQTTAGIDPGLFEAERRRLSGLAYRLLGSWASAEDIVQDAWLRAGSVDDVRDPAAWLTTVVVRLCLDELGSARHRRERYVGPWLPEPVPSAVLGPLETAEQRELVSLGMLRLMEALSPAERAVFVLREGFAYPYAEIATVTGLGEPHCRQLHRRAREHLASRPACAPDPRRATRLTRAVLGAAASGDLIGLEQLLAADVVLLADGGGQVTSARRPILGSAKVGRFLAGIFAPARSDGSAELSEVNGEPAALLLRAGGLVAVLVVRRTEVLMVTNPAKLVTYRQAASSLE